MLRNLKAIEKTEYMQKLVYIQV